MLPMSGRDPAQDSECQIDSKTSHKWAQCQVCAPSARRCIDWLSVARITHQTRDLKPMLGRKVHLTWTMANEQSGRSRVPRSNWKCKSLSSREGFADCKLSAEAADPTYER